MLQIFIQDSYQFSDWTYINEGPPLVCLIPHLDTGFVLTTSLPLDNYFSNYRYHSQVWCSASISTAIVQVFGMTQLWFELTTFRYGGEHSTFTLPTRCNTKDALFKNYGTKTTILIYI